MIPTFPELIARTEADAERIAADAVRHRDNGMFNLASGERLKVDILRNLLTDLRATLAAHHPDLAA